MADYLPCAGSPITLTATADQTGLNTGNYTAAFTAGVLGTMPAVWEWYHAVIDTAVPGVFTSCPIAVRRNALQPITFSYPAGGTEYDPSQPVQFRSSDEIYFFFALATSSTPAPRVTMFLRYDAALSVNRGLA